MKGIGCLLLAALCACTGDDVIYAVDASESGPSEAGFFDTGVDTGMPDATGDSGGTPDAPSDSSADAPIVDASDDADGAVAVSCNNNVKDGTETDVDCGGMSCPKCTNGKMCLKNPDCQSNTCKNNVCQ